MLISLLILICLALLLTCLSIQIWLLYNKVLSDNKCYISMLQLLEPLLLDLEVVLRLEKLLGDPTLVSPNLLANLLERYSRSADQLEKILAELN
jgi:hypothetical protein